MNNSVKMLSPFVLYCQKVIPLAFDESMSYYECLCALYSYLKDTVTPAVNNNAEALEEVQAKMVELKDYVDNYFDNLDIQEEVNNKLDEMADSGELASIIAQYLQAQFVYGFDTVADLKAADTLASGNICRILGKTSYETGDGAFYRVRSLTIYDTPDDDEIVALTNFPTLIAEKIPDKRMDDAETDISNIQGDITTINGNITTIQNNTQDTMVIIGDSWSDWSDTAAHPDFTNEEQMWYPNVARQLHLNYKNYSHGAWGFTIGGDNSNGFYKEIQNAVADSTLDRDKVRYVVIYGGYNDVTSGVFTNYNDLIAKVKTTLDFAKSSFPKSEIICCGVNANPEMNIHYSLTGINSIIVGMAISTACLKSRVRYVNTLTYFMDQPKADVCNNVSPSHPTEYGMSVISSRLLSAINGQTPEIVPYDSQINITPTNPTYSGSFSNQILRVDPANHNQLRIWVYTTNTNPSNGDLVTYLSFPTLQNKSVESIHGALYEGLFEVGTFEWTNGSLSMYITNRHTTTGTVHYTAHFTISI